MTTKTETATPKAATTVIKTPAKKVTVSTLNQRVGELDKRLAVARQELKRTSRGSTLANARVAAIESEFKSIRDRLGKINGDDSSDPAVLNAYQREFARLDDRLTDLFGRLSTELSALSEKVDALTGVVAGHDTSIVMLDEGQQSLNQRVDDVDDRVTLLTKLNELPKWPLVVGLVAGFITWLLWTNLFNYTQTMKLADGTVVPITYDATREVGAWFVGALVALAVAGLLYLFAAQRESKVQSSKHTVVTKKVVTKPVESSNTDDTPEEAPTQVLETQGAHSSAR